MNKISITKKYKKDVSQIIYGDSLEILKQIEESSIDHCVTDPPYNISGYDNKKEIGWLKTNEIWTKEKNFKKIDEKWDKFSNNSYEEFTKLWLEEIFRILKPNGNILIFGSYHNIFKIGSLIEKSDKKILSLITWYKRNAFPNITNRTLCESSEFVLWAVNNSTKHAKNWVFNAKELKEDNLVKRCNKCKKVLNRDFTFCPYCGNKNLSISGVQLRNMWDIPSTPTSERKYGKHPSQKPMEVGLRIIKGFTKENETIIDPFAGSGTIPLASHKLNRKFIAIENEQNYCSIISDRINKMEIDYPKGLF